MAISSGLSDDEKKIVERLLDGRDKFYKLEEICGDYRKAAKIRLYAMRKKLGLDLKNIGSYSIDPETCKANVENMCGAVQVPLGFAGPVKVNGEYAKGEFFLPLATTEGSLVASVNRGCSAINASGGASTVVFSNSQTRSMLFKAGSAKGAKAFILWVEKNFSKIKAIAESKSRFLRLERIEPYVIGNNVWLRLSAFTADAMGMNMITIAADEIGKFIIAELPDMRFVSASGNLCVDKKPSAINMTQGRGKKVVAEARIKREVFEKYFKATPESVIELNYMKNYQGSALAGSFGFNAHYANIIAALFIATGQDHAHVVEGSIGFTHAELDSDSLLISVTLPSLQVATIGGGTRIETQRECLQMLSVLDEKAAPGYNALKLAEIFAAGVLAGEMSLLGALSAHHLAKAHMRYNRL